MTDLNCGKEECFLESSTYSLISSMDVPLEELGGLFSLSFSTVFIASCISPFSLMCVLWGKERFQF